jgi:hypothetical protein
MIEWPRTEIRREGRGGHRPGAGRKPNRYKRLLPPLTAAEIVARRHPGLADLTHEELETLECITNKLAEPLPDASRNQKESNRAIFESELNLTS